MVKKLVTVIALTMLCIFAHSNLATAATVSSKTPSEVVNFLREDMKSHSKDYGAGLCLQYISDVYGKMGFDTRYYLDSAINYWNILNSEGKAHNDALSNVPVGADVFFNAGSNFGQYGHVGIYIGNGTIIHNRTIYNNDETVKEYGVVEQRIDNNSFYTSCYLGWAWHDWVTIKDTDTEVQGSEMSQGFDRAIPDGDYLIVCAADPSYFLDIDGIDATAANGTNVKIWQLENGTPQECDVWTLTYNDGFYTIKQRGTNMCLDVTENSGSKLKTGTNVQVWESNYDTNQQWAISKEGDTYRIQARCSGFSLDYNGGQLANGTNVMQYFNNDGNAQKWDFIAYRPDRFSGGGGGGGGGGGWGDDNTVETAAPAPKPTVQPISFSIQDDNSLYFLNETTAQFGWITVFTNGNINDVKTIGCELYDESNFRLLEHEEPAYIQGDHLLHYFRINGDPNESDICYTLSPATNYGFRVYVIYNGQKYYSDWRSFKTPGLGTPSSEPLRFTFCDDGSLYALNENSAQFGWITVRANRNTDGEVLAVGCELYDENNSLLAAYEEPANQVVDILPYRFRINSNPEESEICYTLTPGTNYKFRVYVINQITQNKYYSDWYNIKTLTATETPAPQQASFYFFDDYLYWNFDEAILPGGTIEIFTNVNLSEIKMIGCELYDENNSLLAYYEEPVIPSDIGAESLNHYLDVNSHPEVSASNNTLLSETTYKYREYVIYRDQKYYSNWYSIKTPEREDAPVSEPISFTFHDDNALFSLNETSVQFGWITVYSTGNINDVKTIGCELYDESNFRLLEYEEPANIQGDHLQHYFRINGFPNVSDICYALSPETNYGFRVYVIFNGQKYYSDWRSFKTPGLNDPSPIWTETTDEELPPVDDIVGYWRRIYLGSEANEAQLIQYVRSDGIFLEEYADGTANDAPVQWLWIAANTYAFYYRSQDGNAAYSITMIYDPAADRLFESNGRFYQERYYPYRETTPSPLPAATSTPAPITIAETIPPNPYICVFPTEPSVTNTPVPLTSGLPRTTNPPSQTGAAQSSYPCLAYTTKKGVNVRDRMATAGRQVTQLSMKGTAVTVLGDGRNESGELWYIVQLSDGTVGYIRGDLLSFTGESAANPSSSNNSNSGYTPYASPTPQTGKNTANTELYGLATMNLSTRTGPSTTYEERGTYNVAGQYIKVLARAWDSRNEIWWVKCEIPYNKEIRVLWTGYKRFDSSTLPLEAIPIEQW